VKEYVRVENDGDFFSLVEEGCTCERASAGRRNNRACCRPCQAAVQCGAVRCVVTHCEITHPGSSGEG
jgi:hypothetical protein